MSSTEKIEANLNFGMSTAKQQHCVIQPQILPNLLEHAQKRDADSSHADVVIGALLGTIDGKILNISNCFPMTLKILERSELKKEVDGSRSKEPEYVFDTEYIKKMMQFHRQVNSQEVALGVYISSTAIDKLSMVII